jgi:uncharacterized protein YerC
MTHNAIWFDACGYFKSFAKQFIEACQWNLDEKGLAFFTAKVSSRKRGENKKYLYGYYKTKYQKTPDEVTDADLVQVYKAYLQSRLPDLDVFYDLTYDTASGHSFVVFGVSKGIKVRKKSRVIENHKEVIVKGKKYKKLSEINMDLAIAMFKEGVIYKDIAQHFNVSYQSFAMKMRELGFKSCRKALIEKCSVEEALEMDYIKELINPKETESMNSKIANQVLRLAQQGQSSEEIAQEIGQSKMQVAGIKASISRGTYGEIKKQALAKLKIREKVIAMLNKGKADEKIIAKWAISKQFPTMRLEIVSLPPILNWVGGFFLPISSCPPPVSIKFTTTLILVVDFLENQ